MLRPFLYCLLFLTLQPLVYAQAETKDQEIAFCYSPTQVDVSYQSVLDLPTVAADNTVFYGPDPLQFGELWLPKSGLESAPPLVVLVHGGCWLNAFDVNHIRGLATALASSGYAVWALEYRRVGDDGGGWPGSFDDISLALDKLDLLEKYNLDTNRVALVGHSAGGHLSMLYGSLPRAKTNLKAVIGLAPILDIKIYSQGENSCEIATPKFMGGTASEKARDYDAATLVAKTVHPKSIIIHGTADSIVDPAQAKAVNSAQVTLIDGAGHFDMIHPHTLAFSELLKVLALTL